MNLSVIIRVIIRKRVMRMGAVLLGVWAVVVGFAWVVSAMDWVVEVGSEVDSEVIL